MSQINLNSISGITSITTPAGVDNQLTFYTNDTTERFKIDSVGNLHSNGKLTINPDDGTTTWKRENKNMHQLRDDVYIEGTVNVGDKAGFDATPLGITSFTWVSAGTSYYSLTTNAHAIPQGTNVLIKDSVSGFQEAYNTTSGAGTTITVERALDPSSQLSIANTKVVVYTPADPRGCLNVAKDYAKVRENGFNPILRGFVGSSTTHPVGINTEVFKIEIKRDGTVKDGVATLLHSTREMGSKQRLALTIDDGDSYPDGKNLVLTQTGVKITANDSAFSDANALLEVDGNVAIDDNLDVGSNIKIGNAGVITATSYNGSGASLTNLNASNISSGTVPSARLGSGTASSSTFLAGDSTFKTVTGTTINNNANYRLISGDANANELNAESNLTWNGSKLLVGATSSHAGNLVVKSADSSANQVWVIGRSSDNTGSISFRNNDDSAYTGRIEVDNTTGMAVQVGSSDRLTIDTNGKATFSGDVQIDGDELFIADSIKHVGDTDTLISFPGNDTINFRTAGTERLRISSQGYVTKPNTPAFFATHGGNSASGSTGYITYNTQGAYYNNGSHFDTGSGQFHAPVTGIYHFHFHCFVHNTATQTNIEIILRRFNSGGGGQTTLTRGFDNKVNGNYGPAVALAWTGPLTAGQYVQIYSYNELHHANGYFFGGYLVG